ncbi:uncharacterized protein LOC126299127 isoform X2 [Schistocerca gregaria]|uniref:uncharacterized protein LOC126299127 isoform X2 n=1 Tax=Schistocerca gregaria TaxID=7010 RepID=UPI00211E1F1A|nr:uncharacterized protein LOC126299127 isoform X2 [Schistocerca gregaria]
MPLDAVTLQRAWHQHNILFYSVVCFVCSALVFVEAFEKILSKSKTTWSPLRIFGPPVWLPVTTDKGYLTAMQAMIISVTYCVACCFLFRAQYEGRKLLLTPWLLLHSFVVTYQMLSIMAFTKFYQSSDLALASCSICMVQDNYSASTERG